MSELSDFFGNPGDKEVKYGIITQDDLLNTQEALTYMSLFWEVRDRLKELGFTLNDREQVIANTSEEEQNALIKMFKHDLIVAVMRGEDEEFAKGITRVHDGSGSVH